MAIKIESGIPIPGAAEKSGRRGGPCEGASAALRACTPGQSFVVGGPQWDRAKVQCAMHSLSMQVGCKVKTRNQEDGTVRVWRV